MRETFESINTNINEEKKEFRKYNPTTMTDKDIERAKEQMKGINIS